MDLVIIGAVSAVGLLVWCVIEGIFRPGREAYQERRFPNE